jgi:uroporphyrinogen decarboxylase
MWMTTGMGSRERVLAALHHTEPDRVPINYASNPGIDARLKSHYGLAGTDDEGLRRILGVDFVGVGAPYVGRKLHADIPHRQVDIWGVRTRWVQHENGGYWDFCDFPLAQATEEECAAWPMPSPDDFDYAAIATQCRRLEHYCLYVGGAGIGCIINRIAKLRGMAQVLMDLLTEDPVALVLIQRKQEIELEMMRRSIEAGKGRIDFLWMGEDLGTQIGPMISLDLYRRQIRPWHQKFVDLAKAYGLPVMFHCCGSSSWAFADFADVGIDAVETLQPEAKNMDPAYLKDAFGDRLAFHGCISTAGPVATGSVADVVADCRRILEIMMPGGGYCFAPTHQLQDNTPTGNAVAMYEVARTYGRYLAR